MATKVQENDEAQEAQTEGPDGPLLDLSDAAVKRMIKVAKKRGFVTYDELNEALPQDQMSSEQIEDIMSAISDMGVNVVEKDEDSDEDEADDTTDDEVEPVGATAPLVGVPEKKKEIIDRTDDIFCHFSLICRECMQIFRCIFKYFQCIFQMRVTVRHQETVSGFSEVAHTSISSTFDTDIHPQIIIT